MTISEAIKQIRVRLGMTQQQWASHTGLAISSVVRYEHDHKPSAAILSQLAEIAIENGWADVAVILKKATESRLEIVAKLAGNVVHRLDQLLSAGIMFEKRKRGWTDTLSAQAETDINDFLQSVAHEHRAIKDLIDCPEFNPFVADKDGHAALDN